MNYGFCDLCVNVSPDQTTVRSLLSKLSDLGYTTIALNQSIDESIFDGEKKKKKKGEENATVSVSLVPAPFDTEQLEKEFEGKLKILSRITYAFSDPIKTHMLNQSPNLKKYDLYAVIPKTQAAFQFACSQLNMDIITINSSCTGLKFSRKSYLQAAERGIHFEIQYYNVINPESRKMAIHYSHLFYTFGKSKNVIMTSGADHPSSLRNPYDIINLGRLLGLNEVKAKSAIQGQAKRLILKAIGRGYGKAVFSISNKVVRKKDSTISEIPVKRIKCDV